MHPLPLLIAPSGSGAPRCTQPPRPGFFDQLKLGGSLRVSEQLHHLPDHLALTPHLTAEFPQPGQFVGQGLPQFDDLVPQGFGLRVPLWGLGRFGLPGLLGGLRLFLFIFVRVTYVPAALLVGVWFLMQLVSLGTVAEQPSGGVAYAAHVGGFIFGSVMARLFEEERNPDAL